MTRSLRPTWCCAICREPRLLDRPALVCDRCERIVCSTCYHSDLGRCEPCADAYYLSDEALLAVIYEWPGLDRIALAERARTKALLARFNERDLTRHLPPPGWWVIRVRDLLPELHHLGHVVCNHAHQRETDHGTLCCWSVTAAGLEDLRNLSGAA